MSATAWRPVRRTRSSAGPQPTFTLEEEQQEEQESRTLVRVKLLYSHIDYI